MRFHKRYMDSHRKSLQNFWWVWSLSFHFTIHNIDSLTPIQRSYQVDGDGGWCGNMVETRQCVHIVVVCTGSSLKSFILCLNDMTTRMVCELLLQALLTLGLSVCRARIRFSDWYCQGRRRSNIWIFVGQNGVVNHVVYSISVLSERNGQIFLISPILMIAK